MSATEAPEGVPWIYIACVQKVCIYDNKPCPYNRKALRNTRARSTKQIGANHKHEGIRVHAAHLIRQHVAGQIVPKIWLQRLTPMAKRVRAEHHGAAERSIPADNDCLGVL